MKRVTTKELETFAMIWLAAGDEVIIDWATWEIRVQLLFEYEDSPSPEVFHGLMNVVCVICRGDLPEIKDAMRTLTPSETQLGSELLEHLQQVRPLFDAELHYRAGNLVDDWTLERTGADAIVVRLNFRPKSEMCH